MALNFPGPYEVRIFYVVSLREHVCKLNVALQNDPDPGEDFGNISAITRVGGTRTLENAVNGFMSVFRPFLNTTAGDVQRAELWKYEPDSFDSQFVSTYDLSLAGTSATATNIASQIIWTFRTQGGGSMRVNILDTTVTPGVSLTPPYTGVVGDMAAAILADNNVWLARDDTYPFANSAFHPGQNERLFKRVYRP